MRVTARMFVAAFRDVWAKDEEHREAVTAAWHVAANLNDAMLGETPPFEARDPRRYDPPDPPGFLQAVGAELPALQDASYIVERFGHDAAWIAGHAFPGARKAGPRIPKKFPDGYRILVEQECSDYAYAEMWRLSQWRVPLKVLITYDWVNDPKASLGISQRLEDHLAELADYIGRADRSVPEVGTEYLFIVGAGSMGTVGPVEWHFFEVDVAAGALRRPL